MFSPIISSVFLLSSFLIVACGQGITLPSGINNLTVIDCSSKDSGIDMSTASDLGYVGIGALASQRGAYLNTAAQSILSISNNNASARTLVRSLQSLASMPASNGSSSNGSSISSAAWTALVPYLQFWDGEIMAQPQNFSVYLIFYGTWGVYQKYLVRNFIDSLGPASGSAANEHTVQNWWKITTSNYQDGLDQNVTNQVLLKGVHADNYSRAPLGSSALNPLQNLDIRRIVSQSLRQSFETPDNRGVYLVLTSPDVHVNSFCTSACGYHSSFRYNNMPIAYAHVGNAETQCPTQCTYKHVNDRWVPPNGDLGVDGMMTWLAHVLTEVATNPFQSHNREPGWVVAQSTVENGDLCVWDFGLVKTATGGAEYTLIGRQQMAFLVQRNFNVQLRLCVTVGNGLPDPPQSI